VEYELAGIGSRAVAQIVDLLLLTVVTAIVVTLVGFWLMADLDSPAASYVVGATLIFQFFLFWGYFILFEYYASGKTLGKRLMKVRVVQDNGNNASFLSILLRNLFRLVDMLPLGYLVGVVVILVNGRERRIGDLVAGTMVVKAVPKSQFLWLDDVDLQSAGWNAPETVSHPEAVSHPEILRHHETLQPATGVSAPPATGEGGVTTVHLPGFSSPIVVQQPLPAQWLSLLTNLLARRNQMSKGDWNSLLDEAWEGMAGEGIVKVEPVAAEETGAALLSRRDKLRVLRTLVGSHGSSRRRDRQ